MSDLRDMCPDCQRPYSVHGHGGEGEDAYPVCPPDTGLDGPMTTHPDSLPRCGCTCHERTTR